MVSSAPQVSVVIPTHNRAQLLALTLLSVHRQRHANLEVIVVDEASTDNTPEVVAGLHDSRIRLVRHESPQGVAMARNRGWAESTGDWLAFLDDDDLWAPDKIAAQVREANATGRDWVYVGVVNIDERNVITSVARPLPPEEVVRRLPGYDAVPGGGSNVIARRSLLESVGPFDKRHYNTEDWDMWLRLALRCPPAWVPAPLLARRIHSGNASRNIQATLAGAALIERVHGAAVDYGMLYRWFGELSLRQGNRSDAARFLALAAIRGQVRGVAKQLIGHVRARTHAHLSRHRPHGSAAPPLDDWTAAAQSWLDDLKTA